MLVGITSSTRSHERQRNLGHFSKMLVLALLGAALVGEYEKSLGRTLARRGRASER